MKALRDMEEKTQKEKETADIRVRPHTHIPSNHESLPFVSPAATEPSSC